MEFLGSKRDVDSVWEKIFKFFLQLFFLLLFFFFWILIVSFFLLFFWKKDVWRLKKVEFPGSKRDVDSFRGEYF